MFFFFNDTATTEIYTLSLHDALPILPGSAHAQHRDPPAPTARHPPAGVRPPRRARRRDVGRRGDRPGGGERSEEHTSELQSRQYLVCRLLLEKKNTTINLLLTIITPL